MNALTKLQNTKKVSITEKVYTKHLPLMLVLDRKFTLTIFSNNFQTEHWNLNLMFLLIPLFYENVSNKQQQS